MQPRKLGSLFGLFILALTLGLTAGCGGEETANPPAEPTLTKPSRTTRIEMRDPKTGELSRTHVYENGAEVETQISYRNGERGVIAWRKDKTQASLSIYAKAGHLRQQIEYHADGKLEASTKDFRADGTLLSQVTITADESASTETVYWFDGKRVFSKRTSDETGQSLTYYRKDGSVWVKHIFNRWSLQAVEEYGPGGNLTMKREIGTQRNLLITTVYRTDGTVSLRYTARASWGGPFSSWTYLQRTEVLDASGKVTRSYEFEISGSTEPTQIIDYHADGTSTLRWVDRSGPTTVIREELRDKDGLTVLSTKETPGFTLADPPLDPSVIATPTPRDPQSLWQLQERDPSKRNDPDA